MDGDGNVVGNPLVTTGGLYAWAARERHVDVDVMIELLGGRDEKGRLHPAATGLAHEGRGARDAGGPEGTKARAEAEAAELAEEAAREGEEP